MARTRPPYPPEFRLEAVRLLRSGAADAEAVGGRAGLLGADAAQLAAPGRGRSGRAPGCAEQRGADAVARARAGEPGAAPGAGDPEAGRGFLCQGERSTVTRFRFVDEEAAQFPVSLLCRVMGVTRQGFYAWKRRPPSARELADRELSERIRQIHAETEGIYGAPRIHAELQLEMGSGSARSVSPG